MAVTAPVMLSKIVTEFGSDGAPSLRDYPRGGTYVPDTAANAAISTSASSLILSTFLNSEKISSATKSGDAVGSFFSALSSPPASRSITTNSVTISGPGLTSVTWTRVSGDVFTVNTISTASASFTISVPRPAGSPGTTTRSAVYRATGNNGGTVDVNVTATYEWNFTP